MKQLLAVFRFDIIRNMKSFMGVYMLIFPVILLIILRSFLPSVESSERLVAIVSEGPNAVNAEMIQYFDEVSEVKTYDSIEDMENKLRNTGTAEGLYWDPAEEQYVSVLERSEEGNAVFSFSAQTVRRHYYEKNYPNEPSIINFISVVPDELADRSAVSPVSTMGGAIFLVYMMLITSFVIGLGIVNDKEEGTDRAIRVSPVSKIDYFFGKSIQPLLIILIYTIISLLSLKLLGANILQVYLVVVASFALTLLLGLIIGALGKNETEAMGYGKALSTVAILAILGGTLLPDSWQWAVWWAPHYWVYNILEEIFTQTGSWVNLGWKTAIMLGLTGTIFVLLRKKIIKGLS